MLDGTVALRTNPRNDNLGNEIKAKQWYPKYLINPSDKQMFGSSVCQTSISPSVLVLVLSHYKNYELR